MLWLKTYTGRIQRLLDAQTPEDATYAALECRLALERVCYERLRIAHDYIAHEDLKAWRPRQIIEALVLAVDPKIASEMTLSIGEPISGEAAPSLKEYQDQKYTSIGTQVSLDAKKLGNLWNALGYFLHVKVPETRDEPMDSYGDPDKLRRKVEEVLVELRRLQQATLIFSGLGETVTFPCPCGAKNKRRAGLLVHGQVIHCVGVSCPETYRVHIDGDDMSFEALYVDFPCYACTSECSVPKRLVLDLKRSEQLAVTCGGCGAKTALSWALQRSELPANSTSAG